jgi:hypothetical protein
MKMVYYQDIMLGYVTIEKNELKVRDYTLYQGYYCGICKSIARRIGQIPRLGLSYDAVFLALVLAGFEDTKDTLKLEHCITHPIEKKPVIYDNAAIDYGADVMVILTYHKFLDDWKDEKSVAGFAGKTALRHAYKKLEKRYQNLCTNVEKALTKLSLLEEGKSTSVDQTAEAFSDLMEVLFTGFLEGSSLSAKEEKQTRVLAQLGRALGRWIYIIDALDDYEKDMEKGCYNPLIYRKNHLDGMDTLLYQCLGEIAMTYDLLELKQNTEIVENIIFMGLRARTDQILRERIDTDEQSI